MMMMMIFNPSKFATLMLYALQTIARVPPVHGHGLALVPEIPDVQPSVFCTCNHDVRSGRMLIDRKEGDCIVQPFGVKT